LFCIYSTSIFWYPLVSIHAFPDETSGRKQSSLRGDETAVLGGRRISGFLVIPDGATPRHDFPTLEFSTFSKIIGQSGIEQYQGLIHPLAPKAPFGFIFAATLGSMGSNFNYVVPPEVIEKKEVAAWKFVYEEWQRKPSLGRYWFHVTHAEPLR
jgi:hypothetical protein